MAGRYVALLRGINVGGKNLISMADLRATLDSAGYRDVQTYIQSGNVVFASDMPRSELEPATEAVLADVLGVPVLVVVRSHRQLANVVAGAPEGFGADTHLSDVVFLKSPLTPAKAMKVVSLREGVDAAWKGTGVLYFARLAERRTQSRFSRIVSTPEYQLMTIRNWNTTRKLLAMLDERAETGRA